MNKKESANKKPGSKDPDSMSIPGKIAAALLLLLFAVYLIFIAR